MWNSVVCFLYETVVRYPDKICLSDAREQLDFRTFFTRACRLAAVLREGRFFNQPVLVFLPKSAAAVTAFAGVLLSGNCYVPADTASPRRRLQGLLANLAPACIISLRKYAELLGELAGEETMVVYLDDPGAVESRLPLERLIAGCREITDRVIDVDPCYIIYTSGSTGVPKGVVIAHHSVIDYIDWAVSCLGVNRDDIIGNQAPLYFDNSTLDIYLSWCTGAALHLIPEQNFMFPVSLLEYMRKQRITFIFFVPSVLINMAQAELLTPGCLPDLAKVVFAGEVMPAKHLGYWQKVLPDKLYVNLYGPTEITVDCTFFIVDRIYAADEQLPIGYPCRNSDVLILNRDNRPAGVNEHGELCVRGTSLALGYWNNPQKTGQVFVQNPLQKNYPERIYRTGDIVYKNEQDQIIFVGRLDSQIKHLGYRIELGEIELAAGSLADINKCCVLYNKPRKEITLFYEGARELSLKELRRALTDLLPPYMVPRKYHYFSRLPQNANGKIDRQALTKQFLEE